MLSEQEILKNKLSIYTIAIFFGLNVQPIHWTCLHRNIELKNYLLVRTLKRFEACVDGLKNELPEPLFNADTAQETIKNLRLQ